MSPIIGPGTLVRGSGSRLHPRYQVPNGQTDDLGYWNRLIGPPRARPFLSPCRPGAGSNGLGFPAGKPKTLELASGRRRSRRHELDSTDVNLDAPRLDHQTREPIMNRMLRFSRQHVPHAEKHVVLFPAIQFLDDRILLHLESILEKNTPDPEKECICRFKHVPIPSIHCLFLLDSSFLMVMSSCTSPTLKNLITITRVKSLNKSMYIRDM